MCSYGSVEGRVKALIGTVVALAATSLFMGLIHVSYDWSVVDGQLHRGYYWLYIFLCCVLVRCRRGRASLAWMMYLLGTSH